MAISSVIPIGALSLASSRDVMQVWSILNADPCSRSLPGIRCQSLWILLRTAYQRGVIRVADRSMLGLQGSVIAGQQRPQSGCGVSCGGLSNLDGQALHCMCSWPPCLCYQRHQVLHRPRQIPFHVSDVPNTANCPVHPDSLHCGITLQHGERSDSIW